MFAAAAADFDVFVVDSEAFYYYYYYLLQL